MQVGQKRGHKEMDLKGTDVKDCENGNIGSITTSTTNSRYLLPRVKILPSFRHVGYQSDMITN